MQNREKVDGIFTRNHLYQLQQQHRTPQNLVLEHFKCLKPKARIAIQPELQD